MHPHEPGEVDLARRIYDFGLTEEDFGRRRRSGGPQPRGPALDIAWPTTLAPVPAPLAPAPRSSDPLPSADVLVVTWTQAEMLGLANVLTPGVQPRSGWYRYDRAFGSYLSEIRQGAPARSIGRLGSYYPTTIGGRSVVCVKSELHLNQDSISTGPGTATLPVARFIRQMIDEVEPSLVITVGTAGATLASAELGDVMITRAARFRCAREFANEPFAGRTFRSPGRIRTKHLAAASALMAAFAPNLVEPDFGPPSVFYPGVSMVPGHVNTPSILVEGRDFARGLPMLTTDFFEFGTSTNGLDQLGCGVEMGDAVFGLVAEEMGADAPKWLVIRNVSDPLINGNLPTGPPTALNMQAHWAVWFYEAFGYWTSVNSAIATWAQIAP